MCMQKRYNGSGKYTRERSNEMEMEILLANCNWFGMQYV